MVVRARAAYDEGDYETAIDFSNTILNELRSVRQAEQSATIPSAHFPQEHHHWPVGLMALGIMLLIYGSVEFGILYPSYVELQDQYSRFPDCTPGSTGYALCIAERTALTQGIERAGFILLVRAVILSAGAISIFVAWRPYDASGRLRKL